MAQSIFSNIPWGAVSLVLIVLGTIVGGYNTYLDNKTITNLLEQNKEWSQKMDDKFDENSKLTLEIKNISDSLQALSEENEQILKENAIISKEIKEVSGKTEQIARNTEKLAENINSNTEAIKFFNGVNFTYLSRVFPKGFTVFRQNKNTPNFKKVYGEKLFYEQFDVQIIKNEKGQFSVMMDNIRLLPEHINMSGGSITVDGFNPKEFKKCQIINPVVIIPNMSMAVLMIDDGYEYTFAVGFTTKEFL